MPVDHAEYWIRMGYASYSPPVVTPTIPELTEVVQGTEDLKTTVATTSESLAGEVRGLSGQLATLSTAAAVEGIAIIVLAIAVIVVRRKPA